MRMVLLCSGTHTGSEHKNGLSVYSGLLKGPEHENGFSFFLIWTQVLNLSMVLVYSGLKTGSEHEYSFSIFWSAHRS
jgi:hypothetical protein